MPWRQTWDGHKIAIEKARWWRSGTLVVDGGVADAAPCNDYFSPFSLYAAIIRDGSGIPHLLEVVERPWLGGRSLYQLLVDGALLSRRSRHAPDPPDWGRREETEARGLARFILLYARAALGIGSLILALVYLNHGVPSASEFARDSLLVFGGSLLFHGFYATLRWRNYVRVNRCRRRKLLHVPAAQQGAAADRRLRLPIDQR